MQKSKKFEIIGYFGMFFTAISLLLLGSVNILGWVIAITGSVLWVAYGILLKLYPILGINLILIIIDIRGLLIWLH
jgi:hypothetical protein